MGADLITYIMVGPKTVELTPEAHAAESARLDILLRDMQTVISSEPADEVADDIADEIADLYRESYEYLMACLVAEYPDGASFLDAAIEFWNNPFGRDANVREGCPTPDEKIVVGGDTSYGDEPEGSAYEMMRVMDRLRICDALGIK